MSASRATPSGRTSQLICWKCLELFSSMYNSNRGSFTLHHCLAAFLSALVSVFIF